MKKQPARNLRQKKRVKYAPPAIKDFSYGEIVVVKGFSGVGCPPRRPMYEDNYGGDI